MANSQFVRKIIPGDVIGKEEDLECGDGTYKYNGNIYSSLYGNLYYKRENNVDLLDKMTASVVCDDSADNFNYDTEFKPGSIVIGRVFQVTNKNCQIHIYLVDGRKIGKYSSLKGIVRKENVHPFEISNFFMGDCFSIGDIVMAKVIVGGVYDMKTFGIALTTNSSSLGVIMAFGSQSRSLLVPSSWDSMVCPVTGLKEPRKVAKIELSL